MWEVPGLGLAGSARWGATMVSRSSAGHTPLHGPGGFAAKILWHKPHVYKPMGGALCAFSLWFLSSHCFVAVTSFEINKQMWGNSSSRDFQPPNPQGSFFLVVYLATLPGNMFIVMAMSPAPLPYPPNQFFPHQSELTWTWATGPPSTDSVCMEHSTDVRLISAWPFPTF